MSMNRGLAAAAMMAIAGGYGGRIVVDVDPAGPEGDFSDVVIVGGDPMSIVDFDYAPPRKATPVEFQPTHADTEALRRADQRRKAKAARQAKGFR